MLEFNLDVISLRRMLGERSLLQDITFSVRAGDRLFVTGPSGVGKTLLQRLIACLDEAQVGSPTTVLSDLLSTLNGTVYIPVGRRTQIKYIRRRT